MGLRPPHYPQFLTGRPSSVGWVEVITENFLDWTDRPAGRAVQTLERIRSNVPVALHGVSMSIGSAEPLNSHYMDRLKILIRRIDPIWVSDHLCWTGVDGENLHDLLPLPYTEEALDLVVRKIGRVQDELGRRVMIENVSSYLEYEVSQMTEWEFVREVVSRADCGLLLDINNIYVSSVNHGFDPIEYLRGIPRDRIGQIHLAGHSNQGGYLIDTHDAPICDEVWELYRWAARNLRPVSTMVERDAQIPEWSELESELKKAAAIRIGEGGRHVALAAAASG